MIPLEKIIYERIKELKTLKTHINDAIRYQQEAQQRYDKLIIQANSVGARICFNEIKETNNRERNNENSFKEMVTKLDRYINKEETRLEEQKKKDDDRKKREDEQRRAPLSEGYHGPYRLRRG